MDDSPWGHKDSETEQQQYLLKAGKSHTTKIIGLRAPTQCKKGRYTTRKDERKKNQDGPAPLGESYERCKVLSP